MKQFDLIIVGGGPAGYVAAIRATQVGIKKIAILEKDTPGGVCLNWGCVPSKALIHQAEIYSHIKDLENMGVKVDSSGLDFSKIYKKSRHAAKTLSKGVEFLIKKNKIELIKGEFSFVDKTTLKSAEGQAVKAKNIILATGSRPREIPGFKIDEDKILSSTGALSLQKLPKKIIILGSGAIGVEFAHVWNSFGVEVEIIEVMPRFLPIEDEDVSAVLRKSFEKRGIKVSTKTKATAIKTSKDNIELTVEDTAGKKSIIKADKLLLAVGRAPNTEKLGLEKVGIKTDRGFIPVGDYYETTTKGIFAIGDLVPSPLLAHVGSKEGEIAVEYIAGHGKEKKIDPMAIPGCTYCEPQVASFGLTEWKAKEEKVSFKTATFPYRGAGKSVCIEQSDGIFKIIFDPKTKEILGAHIVGAEATELIHEILLAKKTELLPEDLATMIHAHPTLSEGVMEVMRAVEGWAIHA